MSNGQQNPFIRNLSIKDLLYAIVIIGLIILNYASFGAEVKQNSEHRQDERLHMPLLEKEKHFVTRKEYDAFKQDVIQRIFDQIRDINNKLDSKGGSK